MSVSYQEYQVLGQPYVLDQYKCCIPGCNTGEDGAATSVGLFPLPNHKGKYTAWVNRIKSIYPDWRSSAVSRICGLHFADRKPSKEPDHSDYCPTIFPIPVVQDRGTATGSSVYVQNLPPPACNGCSCCSAKDLKIKELDCALVKCRELNKTLAGEAARTKTDIQLLKERLRALEGKAETSIKFSSSEHVLNVNINMLRKQLNQELARTEELQQKLALKIVEIGELRKEMSKLSSKEHKELRFDQKFVKELETERKHAAQYKEDSDKLKDQKKEMRNEITALREIVKNQLVKIKQLEKADVATTSLEDLRVASKRPKVKKQPVLSVNRLLKRGIKLEKLDSGEEEKSPPAKKKSTTKKVGRKGKNRRVRFEDTEEDTDIDEGTLSQIVLSKITKNEETSVESDEKTSGVKVDGDKSEESDGEASASEFFKEEP